MIYLVIFGAGIIFGAVAMSVYAGSAPVEDLRKISARLDQLDKKHDEKKNRKRKDAS